MILIAHRGNIEGPFPDKENKPEYIDNAINLGYNVEIDVRGGIDNGFFLGHDYSDYQVSVEWLFERKDKLWLHCKQISSLHFFVNFSDSFNCFWHQKDCFTLTTKKYIWTYPGKVLTPNSICVMPEKIKNSYTTESLSQCAGICSDFIGNYK